MVLALLAHPVGFFASCLIGSCGNKTHPAWFLLDWQNRDLLDVPAAVGLVLRFLRTSARRESSHGVEVWRHIFSAARGRVASRVLRLIGGCVLLTYDCRRSDLGGVFVQPDGKLDEFPLRSLHEKCRGFRNKSGLPYVFDDSTWHRD